VDALDRFEPRWFLGENVRGLLCHSSEGHPDPLKCPRCYFEGVIMRDLRARFAHAGYWLLDAADYGVPQHRRRVILWAGPAPLRAPQPTHADPATLAQGSMFGPRLLPWVSMGEALGLSGEVHSQRTPETAKGCNRWTPTDEPSPTVPSQVAPHFRGPPMRAMRWPPPGPKAGNVPSPVSEPAPTVAGGGLGLVDQQQATRRRLTVEECAILQDFPPDHPWQGPKVAQYRQVGNAVCPLMSEAVGRIVVAADRALE
jgi:DNA (cytosine-5)-methyltransferase 1